MDKEFTGEYVELPIEVSEMTDDARAVLQLDSGRVEELKDIYGDEKPKFAILRVRAGEVSGNGFNWPESILADVAEQINTNQPPGFFGHISKADRSWRFPEPNTVWLKAKVKSEGGKPTLFTKGYLVPGTPARTHVPAGVVKMASWFGKADGAVINGVTHVKKFMLESIDWARPGAAAMDARVVAVVSEQIDEEGNMELATLTLDALRQGNPSLFTLMEQEVTAKVKTDLNVSEMEEEINAGNEAKSMLDKVRELFGVDPKKDILEAMTEVHERLDNESSRTLKEKLGEILGDKLKNPKAKATVLRLLPVSEMTAMSDDELKTAVDEAFDKDEQIQVIVSEMEQGRAPLQNVGRGINDRNGKDKVGASNMVTVGSRKI
jgi:hypothetical protein